MSVTIGQLKTLIEERNNDVKSVMSAYALFADRWMQVDLTGYSDWLTDWRAFMLRFDSAVEEAQVFLKTYAFGDRAEATITGGYARPHYVAIHLACKADPGEGGYRKGDLQDLYNRMVNAPGAPPIYVQPPLLNGTAPVISAPIPQPVAPKTNWVAIGTVVSLGLLGVAFWREEAYAKEQFRRHYNLA